MYRWTNKDLFVVIPQSSLGCMVEKAFGLKGFSKRIPVKRVVKYITIETHLGAYSASGGGIIFVALRYPVPTIPDAWQRFKLALRLIRWTYIQRHINQIIRFLGLENSINFIWNTDARLGVTGVADQGITCDGPCERLISAHIARTNLDVQTNQKEFHGNPWDLLPMEENILALRPDCRTGERCLKKKRLVGLKQKQPHDTFFVWDSNPDVTPRRGSSQFTHIRTVWECNTGVLTKIFFLLEPENSKQRLKKTAAINFFAWDSNPVLSPRLRRGSSQVTQVKRVVCDVKVETHPGPFGAGGGIIFVALRYPMSTIPNAQRFRLALRLIR
ncbi:uncharacterized protein LACBIDRAFT_321387 [Laccaria bicolor S238N-H82]|uniref:Predicted protein n=1 Tax=Laccaria bicolor (strain S238N-H82 / ATCC MYA-4686) TaxID=486041 RepID=B0CQ07_LACBS|nr:uncharacterized protein LACBIDRAFT_321387 [Laccaria bicolor S238N-H82]EDR16155.1 predicted protein [Laccaria bicolor S238N-H82]|eukprot:XP_001874363.1 predicted protein [Laccaria bicolor S238N-H82]